jgi:hypothetical protein
MVPKLCRMAWKVEDMDSFTRDMSELVGAKFFTPGLIAEVYPNADFKVMFGEHGIEPIQPGAKGLGFGGDDSKLIELAIDVADAEVVRAKLEGAGYKPTGISWLPVPAVNEYLFGPEFHGVPFLACTEGVNEQQIRSELPFDALDDAAAPKMACATVVVDDAAAFTADLKKFYDMDFIETDPAGFGRLALVGTHRVKIIEGPSALLADRESRLASVDLLVGDVEATKAKFEAKGFAVKHTRPLASGGKAYYFGATVQGLPLTLYPVSADAEILGQVAARGGFKSKSKISA